MILEGEKTVVIVGLAGAGKTTVARNLLAQFPHFSLYHGDDYIEHNSSLQVLMNDFVYFNSYKFKMVEGVVCYKMLLEGLESKCFYPDLVINVLSSSEIRGLRRPDKDYKQMDATLRLMWLRYNRMPNARPPRLLELLND